MLMPSRFAQLIVMAALLAGTSSVLAKATPEQKCQATKNQVAGKYAVCRQNAEAKRPTTDQVKYQDALDKCEAKFTSAWQKAIDKAAAKGASCPDGGRFLVGAFQSVIDEHTDNVATALAGGDLETCGGSGVPGQLLQTGQADACWDSAGVSIDCAGTGQDGELKQGLTRVYVDDGPTVTDTRTGLVWEKLVDDDGFHDKDNLYTWDAAFAKVAALNTDPCFTGHCDWRVPNVQELHSLVVYGSDIPSVASVFDSNCTPSCTVATCSCTIAAAYWSSTTYLGDGGVATAFARTVVFDAGPAIILYDDKTILYSVRAVRGGA